MLVDLLFVSYTDSLGKNAHALYEFNISVAVMYVWNGYDWSWLHVQADVTVWAYVDGIESFFIQYERT